MMTVTCGLLKLQTRSDVVVRCGSCDPEGLAVTLTPDQGTTFNISRRELTGSKCAVCSGGGLRRSCSSSVVLRGPEATPVEFTCPSPEGLFTVRVSREIVCTSSSCSEDVRQTDSGSRPLQSFARTFSWTLRASGPSALLLDVSPTGLTQIQPAQACPDQHTYSLQAFQSTGTVVLGTYCRGGSVSGVQLPRLGQLSLEVPGGVELEPAVFPVAVGEDIKSLAVVTVTAPGGTLSTELFSPNYPDGFSDDDLMEWRFAVQPKHSSSITFLAVSRPRCLKKEAGVGYQRSSSGVLVLGLDDPQPTRLTGSFSLTLRNCEVDLKHPGLSLHLLVSTTRGSPPALCRVDLRNRRGFSIHVEKTPQAGPDCELKLNSDVLQEATALSGSVALLAFQSCLPHHLLLTASKLIECSVLKDCPAVPLTIPPMPSCFPTPLHRITWLVRPPRHAAVELLPGGGLTQLHPGDHHQCHGNVTLTVAEGDGTPIGQFCPQGAVGKVQVYANMTITANALEGSDLRLTSDPVINISFSQRISERYIFTLSVPNTER
ncbi:CUB domain-containing protein 1-like isoform X2 [Osmerus eperlanus]|uniref:CUB domain-containing protein 1-like isoform X2 n=1 Tax=Osmerus eperlanus TaxID=29151 RepID=UPI002E12D746